MAMVVIFIRGGESVDCVSESRLCEGVFPGTAAGLCMEVPGRQEGSELSESL